MIPVAIVSIVYSEPSWAATRSAIEACQVPSCFIDRGGVGNLAKAINAGAAQASALGPRFLWVVTNVGFGRAMLPWLMERLEARPDMAALHPAFCSDHVACQPDGSGEVREVPFVEFTCPLVRAEALLALPLDERMPYWGHDLDWGHRARLAGWKIGIDHGAPAVEHAYIRNSNLGNPVTRRRQELRKLTNRATTRTLEGKYGPDWRATLGWL